MNDVDLDPRLAKDCIVLGQLDISLLLLMNNALVPWFVLVPRTSFTDLTDLPRSEQVILLEEVNLIAEFIKRSFTVSKLNIASIGNVVSQLHVHVVGRHRSDFCWPDVVWGTTQREHYDAVKIRAVASALRDYLGERLS